MAQKPDFFVKFDSNADDWARSLKGPFDAVQAEIGAIKLALEGLDRSTRKTGGSLNKELTKHTGGLGNQIRQDLDKSADSLNAMVADLGAMMKGLQQLPRRLGKMRKELLQQERQLILEMTGQGQSKDAKGQFTGGRGGDTSQSQRITNSIQKAVQLGVEKGLANAKPVRASVKDVSRESIDRGAADRIIRAIEKQTKQMGRVLPRRIVGGDVSVVGEVSGAEVSRKRKKSRTSEAAREEVKVERKRVSDLDAAEAALTIAKFNHAQNATKQSKKQVEAAQKERDAVAAAAAAKDRTDRGVSRTTQREERKAQARKEAEERRASAPEITKKQREKRKEQLSLLQDAGDPGLLGRVGRKKGDVTVDRLKQIADALTKQGFNVPYSARTKKDDLAESVSKAGRRFWKSTGGELPDSLRTDGRTIQVDEIPKRVKKLIGDVNRYVKSGSDLIAAQELLKASGESGGRAPYLGDAPDRARRKVAKGAYTYGSAINEYGVPGEFAGTRAEVDAARAMLKNPVTGPIYKLARERVQDPKFNPYALDLTVKGKGPEAVSTRAALAGLRAATEHIDKLGKEFFQLSDAVKEGEKKIKDARTDIRRAEERLDSGELGKGQRRKETRTIERRREEIDRLSGAQDTLLGQMAVLSKGPLGKIFRSPGYREGMSAREYPVDNYPGAREMFEGRIEALRKPRRESEAESLQMATMQAIAGLRTAIGSRAVVGNIPGLSARPGQRRNQYDLVGTDLDAKQQQELSRAAQHYSAVQRKLNAGKLKGTVDEIANQYENAAVRLAGTMQKLFGLAPAIETLTGTGIRQEKNVKGEQERQAARDLSQDRLRKRIQRTYGPGEFLGESQANVERNTAAQKAATKRRAEADKKLTEARTLEAAEEERLLSRLTESQRKRRRALQRQLKAAEAEVNTIEQRFAQSGRFQADQPGQQFLLGDTQGPKTKAQFEAEQREPALLAARVRAQQAQEKIDAYGTSDPRVATRISNAQKSQKDAAKTLVDITAALKRDVDTLQRVKQVMRLAAEGAEALGYTADEAKFLRPEIARQTGFTNKQVDQILRQKALPGPTQLDEAQLEFSRKQERQQLQDRLKEILPTSKKGKPLGTQAAIDVLEKQAKAAEALVTGRAGGQLKAAVTRARTKGDVEGLYKAEETLQGRQQEARNLRALATEAKTSATRLKELHTELSPTLSKEKEAARVKAAETAATKQATAAVNEEIATKKGARGYSTTPEAMKLREERRKIQALPHTVTERKAAVAAGDTALAKTIQGRLDRLKQIKEALAPLNAAELAGRPPGSGGGGKGGKGVGDGDDNIFRLMLAELKKINTALRNGVRTTGARGTGDASGPPRGVPRASTEELRLLQSENPADVKRAAALERERLKNTTGRTRERAQVQTVKDLAKAQKENAEASRQAARDQQVLQKAMSMVTDGTKKEVAALERLNKTGASATDITKQQQRVYQSVADDLQYSAASRGRDDVARALIGSASPQKPSRGEFTQIKNTAMAEGGFAQIGGAWADDAMDGFASHFGGRGFWNRLLATTGTFIVRNFAAGLVFGLTNALQDVIVQAIQTEATFIRVSAALDAAGQSVGNLRSDLQSISQDYGIALNDVYTTAAGLTGLFDSAEDTAAATRIVGQLQAISGGALNAQEAMGVLASTVSAFAVLPGDPLTDKLLPGGVEGFQKVADVLTVIQSNMGVNIETSAEGVSRMAGLARQMQLSFEETAVFVGQIAKLTNQTGAAAGEQFSRIIGALQTGRGRSAVQDAYGPAVQGALAQGDYGAVFKVMIKGYDDLSDAQKRSLIVNVAGQRQAAAFNALMNNGAKTLNILAKAEDANGEATERMAKLMNTLNMQLAKLRTNAQNFANELVRTGILNFLGVTLKATNELLNGINKLLSTLNNFADNNAFLDFLRKGITGLLGFAVAFKLIQTAARGLKGAMAAAIPREIRDARAARLASREAPGIARPAFGLYGGREVNLRGTRQIPVGIASPAVLDARQRRAYLSRGVGFGADRTIGVGFEAAARGLNAGAAKWASVGDANRRGGQTLIRGSEALVRAATALRGAAGFQGLGGGRSNLGPFRGTSALTGSIGSRLTAGAALRQSIFADQTEYARRGAGSAAPLRQAMFRYQLGQQGLGADDIATRTQAPNRALARQAAAMQNLGRVANGTSRGLGGVSDAFSKLNSSGILADGAMIGLAIGITALVQGLQDQAAASKELQAANADFFAETEEQKKALKDPNYYGRNYADFQQTLVPQLGLQEADGVAGFFQKFQTGLQGAGALLTQGNPFETFNDLRRGDTSSAKEALARQFGLENDLGETKGFDFANDFIEAGFKRLDNVAGTGDDIREVQEELQKRLAAEKDRILNSGDSARQKQAALANLEVVGRRLAEKAQDLAGIADGIDAKIGQTTQQIQSVQEYVNTLSSLNGNALAFAPQLEGLYEETGVETSGGQAQRILEKMMSGGDSTTIAIGNVTLLRDQIKQLYNNWQTLLISNGPDDPDVQAARQLFVSTLAQYGQANDQAIEAISQQSTEIATELSDQGNFTGAVDAYNKGMERMAAAFRRQQREIRRAFNAARKAAQAAREAARQAFTDAIEAGLTPPANFAFPDTPLKPNKKSKQEQARKNRAKMVAKLREAAELALAEAVRAIDAQIAAAISPAAQAALQAARATTVADFYATLNSGKVPEGSGLSPQKVDELGNQAVTEDQLATTQNDATRAELDNVQAQRDRAAQARADAAALQQARLGVAAAWADARGDAVASAKVQVAMAKAAMAAARAELAAARTASERSAAMVAIYTAQAQLISAVAAVQQSQMDLVQSQYDVTIALATAAGHTVQAASLTLQQARAALGAALRKSGGKATAEVNQARVQVINAEAAARDAKLQDELDTIDFNLQMGRITQSSAINALQEILRTHELTKAQRRQLLLQIKGMKDEMANSQWNFGDIKLPTPYQMRRYIDARKKQFRDELDQAAGNGGGGGDIKLPGDDRPGPDNKRNVAYVNQTTIEIDGADIGKIRQIIREVVGDSSSINTRTTGARRGGRY